MLKAGDSFDRYTIEALLGEGGMGRVYRAHDPRLHRKVALKVLSLPAPDPSQPKLDQAKRDSEGSVRMLREARAAAALDHPNAVSIFDVGEVNGVTFIAMELIEGRSLRSYVGRPGVAWDRRLRWLADVARALAAAHKRGLVHRDIKPENVMVREDGVVKVLDFGIARRPDLPVDPIGVTQKLGLEQVTGTGIVVGTPRYMSPEQLRGDALDGRADQFAWGVLAYELLTGRLPWRETGDSLATVAVQLTKDPEPLDVEGMPDLLKSAILQALAKDRDKRFASMDALLRALDPYVAGSSTELESPQSDVSTTRVPPTLTDAAKTEITHATSRVAAPGPKRRAGFALVGLVVVAAAAAFFAWKPKKPSGPATPPLDAGAPVAVTDLPDPPTTNQEALASYRAAMQAYRDGVGGFAARFKRATELDPNLAAAHLRFALASFQSSPSEARASYQRAVELRATLSAHDQALLDAVQPWIVGQPPDRLEHVRRLEEAAKKFPLDAEVWTRLGGAYSELWDMQNAMRARKRAVELDPRFASAWWQLGQHEAYAGMLGDARASLEKCTSVSPTATACLWNEISIDELDGACDKVEAEARRWTAADGRDPLGYFAIAAALQARGKPLEAVREALRQREALETDAQRPKTAAMDAIALGVLRGDFADVEKNARELDRLVANAQAENEHQASARALVDTYVETGRLALAADYAESYLRRREAWLPEAFVEDFAIANDVTLPMQRALAAAGRIDAAELARRRDAWYGAWKNKSEPSLWPYLWIHGYGTAQTKDEVRAALDALKTPLPAYTPKTLGMAYVGRAYALAGRVDDALPVLERAASSCMALEFPFDHTRAQLWLGRAREAKGDKDGACKAYAVVLERWGKAKPRSVSADEARARTKALGCATRSASPP